jgi:hypothetical protein
MSTIRRMSASREMAVVALLAALFVAVVLGSNSYAKEPEADFADRITRLTEEAARERQRGNYERVEQLRRDRWIVASEWEATSPDDQSIWIKAFRAIRAVDGEASAVRPNKKSPGLVNQLRYKEAADALRAVWQEIVASAPKDRHIPGEVAVRLFEVTQQALSCYRDATDETSENFVAKKPELFAALELADARDPCCIVATPMLQLLKPAREDEVFLRAEVRSDFSARQQKLVAISHPLIQRAAGKDPENFDTPVMPWHAPTELAKAANMSQLLGELDYADLLRQSWLSKKGQAIQYIIPGHIFKGRDSLGQPFEFYYGRYFICQVEDKKGRPRTAFMFINKAGKWEHRFLELLWRTPSREELEAEPGLREKQALMESLPITAAWKMGDQAYSIREYPAFGTGELIRLFLQQLCVTDSGRFPRMKAAPLKNDQDAVLDLESTRQDILFTTPFLKELLLKLKAKNDQTRHPLVELLRQRKTSEWRELEPKPEDEKSPLSSPLNPLLLVLDGDRREVSPSFFRAEGKPPYLKLDTGQDLQFDLSDNEGAPSCYVKYPGLTAYMPLSFRGVPLPLITGSPMGQAFFKLLLQAGYSEQEVQEQLRECLDNPTYIPDKFQKQFRARLKSKANAAAGAKRQAPPNAAAEFTEMLRETGWDAKSIFPPPVILSREMALVYTIYGFTYIRDTRGNWVYNKSLNYPFKPDGSADGGKDASLLDDYPWEFRARDGRQRIETSQIYSWPAYQQLERNVVDEHLIKSVAYHPCFAGMERFGDALELTRVHPQDQRPAYLESAPDSKQETAGNRKFQQKFGSVAATDFLLTRAVAGWLCSDKEDQKVTLNNLHNGYAQRLVGSLDADKSVAEAFHKLTEKRNSAAGNLTNEEYKTLDKEIRNAEEAYAKAVEAYEEKSGPLLALQLESARYYAKQAFLHRAIVFYNDLLVQLHARESTSPFAAFLRGTSGVATTESARRFAVEVDNWVSGQRLLLTVQLELAGVLHAAGLEESARQVWQAIVDAHELLLKPSIDQARQFAESYGLRLSAQADKAAADAAESSRLAGEALARIRQRDSWRVLPTKQPKEQEAVTKDLRTIRDCMDRQALQGSLTVADKRDLEQAIERVGSGSGFDFSTWLEAKKILRPRPALALQSTAPISPVRACPFTYVSEAGGASGAGFSQPVLDSVIAEADATRIAEWCGKADDAIAADDSAANHCYLVAWYWLDMDKKPQARDAFMTLARILRARAAQEKDQTKKLTDELSAFHAVLYASSVLQSSPGASGLKADFTRSLSLPLAFWEQRWFASGNYGPHGSGARRAAEFLSNEVQELISRDTAAWRRDRYFFPDYACELGSVPDYLAYQAIYSPRLFKKLEPGGKELAAKGAAAADEDRWPLITLEEVRQFFDELKLNEKVDKEVVHLRE